MHIAEHETPLCVRHRSGQDPGSVLGNVAARAPQGCAQIFPNIGQAKLPGINAPLGDDDNVRPGRKRFPFQAKKLSNQALDAVALNRVADFPPYGKADAGLDLFSRTWGRKAKKKKIPGMVFSSPCIARKEFRTIFDPVVVPEG